jgi:hypothetical protein
MTAAEVVTTSRGAASSDLAELAAEANRQHRSASAALNEAVARGIAAGEALLAARAKVPDGTWGSWLAENFEASDWTAKLYVRFATYRAQLEAAQVERHGDAVALVRELAAGERIATEDDLSRRRHARGRRAQGATYDEIASEIGVDPKTVYKWVNITEVAAARRKPTVPPTDLDAFVTSATSARAAAGRLKQPKWEKVLDALIEQAHRLARAGRECVCPSALDDDGLCLRCGKAVR